MPPQLRNPENYYEAQDRYHANMLVKTLGIDRAIQKCCEEQWLEILQQVQKYNEFAEAG